MGSEYVPTPLLYLNCHFFIHFKWQEVGVRDLFRRIGPRPKRFIAKLESQDDGEWDRLLGRTERYSSEKVNMLPLSVWRDFHLFTSKSRKVSYTAPVPHPVTIDGKRANKKGRI